MLHQKRPRFKDLAPLRRPEVFAKFAEGLRTAGAARMIAGCELLTPKGGGLVMPRNGLAAIRSFTTLAPRCASSAMTSSTPSAATGRSVHGRGVRRDYRS